MRGERNHDRYCRGFVAASEATVRGRLYDLPYGFPALVVPREDVRATGTADYLADAGLQQRSRSEPQKSLSEPTAHGELLTFDDPGERLPALDALEGYVPGQGGFYERVLVPVVVGDGAVLAWVYVTAEPAGVYLPGGRWPA